MKTQLQLYSHRCEPFSQWSFQPSAFSLPKISPWQATKDLFVLDVQLHNLHCSNKVLIVTVWHLDLISVNNYNIKCRFWRSVMLKLLPFLMRITELQSTLSERNTLCAFVSHSAGIKLNDLQIVWSLMYWELLKEPLGGWFLDKVSLHCQHFKKSKTPFPCLRENALMFSISQRVVDFWLLFPILFMLKSP